MIHHGEGDQSIGLLENEVGLWHVGALPLAENSEDTMLSALKENWKYVVTIESGVVPVDETAAGELGAYSKNVETLIQLLPVMKAFEERGLRVCNLSQSKEGHDQFIQAGVENSAQIEELNAQIDSIDEQIKLLEADLAKVYEKIG